LLLEAKQGTSFTATDIEISLSRKDFTLPPTKFLLGAEGFVVVKIYTSFHEFHRA